MRPSRRHVLGSALAALLAASPAARATAARGARKLRDVVRGTPTIDVHAHLVPPGWFGPTGRPAPALTRAQLAAQIARNPYIPVPDAEGIVAREFDRLMRFERARFDGTIETSTAVLISEMDAAGIDVAVNQCMDEFAQPFGRTYVVPVERTLEDVARMAAAHPGRLVNFFGVDPRRGKAGLALMRRAVAQWGVCGMGEWLTNRWNIFPTDRALAYPFFELCAELGIPYGNNGSGPYETQRPEVFETVLRDFPTLKIVHQAAGLLTDAERAKHPDLVDLPYRLLDLAEKHANFHLDIDDWQRLDDAGKARTFAFLRRAFDGPARDRIMFGTDFPVFTRPVSAAYFIGSLLNDGERLGATLTDAEFRMFFSTNALRFLDGPRAPAFIRAAAAGTA